MSAEGRALRSVFFLADSSRFAEVAVAVEDAFAPLRAQAAVYVSGRLSVQEAVKRRINRDMPILVAIALLVVLAVHLLSFGSTRVIALPLAVAVAGTVWTLGLMSTLDIPLTIVTVVVPVLILTLGNSYVVHLLNQYYRTADPGSVAAAVSPVVPTVLLAALTTAAGFGSQVGASIPQMRDFGIATALGILLSAALAVVVVPAALSFFRHDARGGAARLDSGIVAAATRAVARRAAGMRVVALAAAVLLLAGFAATVGGVRLQSDYLRYFRGHETAVEQTRQMIGRFGGYSTLNITLSAPSGSDGYFLRQEVLQALSELEDRLGADINVSQVTSFVSYLRQLSMASFGDDRLPTRRGPVLLLGRYVEALRTAEGVGATLGGLVTDDYDRVTIKLRVFDGERRDVLVEDRYQDLVAAIEERIAATMPPEVRAELWGATLSLVTISERLLADQVQASLLAAGLILVLAAVGLRSIAYGALALVPLGVAIPFSFLVISLLNIPLDMVTISFVSIAFGLGVDSSIHLLLSYRRHGDLSDTVVGAGRAVVLAALPLTCGLLILTLSSFVPLAWFGALVALSVAATAVGALVVLPAILSFKRARS